MPKVSDEEIEHLAMVIIGGVYRTEFRNIGVVEIDLSLSERTEYLTAILKSQASFWGYSIAHYMSADLEALVCGHRPERYRACLEAAK